MGIGSGFSYIAHMPPGDEERDGAIDGSRGAGGGLPARVSTAGALSKCRGIGCDTVSGRLLGAPLSDSGESGFATVRFPILKGSSMDAYDRLELAVSFFGGVTGSGAG